MVGDWTVSAFIGEGQIESSPFFLQNRVKSAYWSGILACAAARSLALSLLQIRLTPGTGVDTPSVHELLRDNRFAQGSSLLTLPLFSHQKKVIKFL